MTATFKQTRLVNNRVVVTGTDVTGESGSCVLNSTQWDDLSDTTRFNQATEAFDAAVKQFFEPLTKAVDAVSSQLEKPTDSISYVVLEEGTDGTQSRPEVLVKLTKDSVILRMLEKGDFSRLMWVGEELEVLDLESVIKVPQQSSGDAGLDAV